MRNINRIDGYMKRLGDKWKEYPEFRFAQMLLNTLGDVQQKAKKDLFFVEDEEFFTLFEESFDEMFEGKKNG